MTGLLTVLNINHLSIIAWNWSKSNVRYERCFQLHSDCLTFNFLFWNPIVLFPIPLFKREDISDKVSKLHSQFSVINTSVIFCLDKFEPE